MIKWPQNFTRELTLSQQANVISLIMTIFSFFLKSTYNNKGTKHYFHANIKQYYNQVPLTQIKLKLYKK